MRALAFVLVVALAVAGRARAQEPASEDVRSTTPAEEAEGHFERALVHYRAGKYRSAIAELETAYGLDPTGKDLVHNLAVVYEKLGDLQSAIHYLERYLEIETDPNEVERARAAIIRLRGAQSEVPQPSIAISLKRSEVASCPDPEVSTAPGRFDGWVAASGGISVAALLVGTAFGVHALVTTPDDSDATGRVRSIDSLRDDARAAQRSARIADIAFALSVVSGSAAAVLYFGRSPGPQAATTVGLAGQF